MTIPTCAVTCSVFDDDGVPMSGAIVTAILDRLEIYNGYVVPKTVTGTTDLNGFVTLNLWPNALGIFSSTYIFKILGTSGKKITITADVPNQLTMPLHLIGSLPAD